MIQQTSLEAFRAIERADLGRMQKEIYTWIVRLSGMTDKEISHVSGYPINIVTARRNELAKLGVIECTGKRPCTITRKTAMTWART